MVPFPSASHSVDHVLQLTLSDSDRGSHDRAQLLGGQSVVAIFVEKRKRLP